MIEASIGRTATWRGRLKGLVATRTLKRNGVDRVVLTFDDGPHPDGTPAVLKSLRRHGARAVFFIVGSRIDDAPDLLRRILDDGHVLGNHSHAHASGRELGLRRYCADLQRCQSAIRALTGYVPTLFRPPLGELSFYSLTVPRVLGMRPILWSVDSDDWRLRREDEIGASASRLTDALSRRGLNDIVLFHDERPLTAMLLDDILPGLVARGVDIRGGIDSL